MTKAGGATQTIPVSYLLLWGQSSAILESSPGEQLQGAA